MVDTVTQAAPLKSYVRITEAVHNWVIENNSKYWDRHIQDYGQIHFTENDRKSWYIRYPFNPPYAVQSASQNDNHQQRKMTALKEKERDDESSFSTINVLQSISHTIVPMQTVSCEPAKHLIELLRDKWELPPPELIISVTGGARSFNLPQQSRTALQKGLVAAAVTADAWVFTGGTHAGVMKDVGEAFEKWTYKTTSVDKTHTRVPVIAIASWYYTANYSQLIQERSQKWDTNSTPISTFDTVADHEKLYRYCAPQKTSKSYPLDPNHTHFILLDDKCGASNDKWEQYGFPVRADLTIQLRAEIEQEARYSSRYRQNYKIPIIQILIEGGPSSLLTMVEAVTHETPVIVIEVCAQCKTQSDEQITFSLSQGTGRAANFIAKAYNALYHNQKTYVPSTNNNPNLERLIKEANGEIITKSNESCFRDMITSEKGFFLINTFLLCPDDSEFKLGDAILEALFRAASMPRHEASDAHVQKLKLAMAWNKFDLAVSDMFIEDNKILWTDTQMDSALLHAIQHGSVQFVELLIEQGASFDRLRRLININDLYKKKTGLPLSNQKVALDDINKQQMYYTHYLNAEALKTVDSFQGTKAPHLSNIDIYGTIENPMEQATNLNGLVVFNGDDAIRQSGNVTQVSIAFSDSRYPSVTIDMLHDLVLYVLSPTSVANSFQLIHMQKIYERDCKYHQSKSIFHVYDFNIYIEQGQYLAVGFLENSRSPSYLDDQGLSYALDIDVVNKLSSTNASIEFKRYIRRVAISFQLVPVSEFIRDIFLWSVFADSFNLSICLCSHSPNAMIAALLASKINKTAAELANDKELAIKYLKKKTEFDVHAAQIIDKCFLQDENFALQLLTTRSHLYFGYSSLKLAEETNNRSFLATRCVQAYADRLWYGHIDNSVKRGTVADILVNDVYSFLDGGSELHANVMDLIVFNIDNYVVSAGTIDKFLINFCRAPTESNAKIKVYIIRSIFNNREHFFVQEQVDSFVTNLRPSVGIQKYQVKPFKVQKGDYVGFKFTKNAGDPFTIKHASYYVEHNVDQSIETKEIMHFNPCANHGITATYTMSHDENRDDSIRKNNFILFKRKTAYSSHVGLTPSSDDKKQLIIDKSGRSSIAVPVRQDLTNLTQFQQRDNMLRESSIAQDYLQLVIENIMREERDDSSRERKSRFKNEQESLKLQNQQEKLIELLQKTINKNQNRSPKNSCSSSYDNDTAV
ncbi:unnamed protein product [Rotaria socialis]|uniref:Uncharacterized protein n=2 Tax=Rotaria TaxID=231623 RepID=A0A817MUV9_9BILA|nr:unnamed protein product [Rotaria socialis]